MADPITSLALTAIGGAVQGFSAMASANYNAKVAENNALMMQQQADQARFRGNIDAQTQDMKTKAILGQQLAQQGASGFDINSKSAIDLRASTAQLGRLDSLTKKNNAEREAYGFEVKKTDYLATAAGQQAAGFNNMFGSLIGTASGVSNKWLDFKSKGLMF